MTIKKFLKKIYDYWMKFVRVLGLINGTIIFTVIYIVIFGIYAILLNLFKVLSFLFTKKTFTASYWKLKKNRDSSVENAKMQF